MRTKTLGVYAVERRVRGKRGVKSEVVYGKKKLGFYMQISSAISGSMWGGGAESLYCDL